MEFNSRNIEKTQNEVNLEISTKEDNTTSLNIVNIKELKTPKSVKYSEDLLWYNKIWAWILFGSIFSFVFTLLSFVDTKYLYLIPMGPIIGISSWYMRKLFRRYDEKTKKLFKQS